MLRRKKKSKDKLPFEYSTPIHHSFGITGFLDNFFTGAFSVRIFSYYEDEIGLLVGWISLAFILYGFWNMVNDPIAGYIQDRPYGFIKKWGRRYPWYMFTAIPYAISYLIIFTVPFSGNQVAIFLWLLFTLCVFDTLYSFWQTSALSLYPVKFRTQNERTKVGALNTMYGLIGIVVGLLVPPIIIGEYGNPITYIYAAIFVSVVGAIAAILIIPSVRENEELKKIGYEQATISKKEIKEGKKLTLKQTIKLCLKQKNFIVYMIAYLAHMVMATFMLGSVPYWVKYIVGTNDADAETIASAGLLLGVLVSIPLWMWVGNKYGNRKAYIFGSGLSSMGLLVFFFFATDLIGAFVMTMILGFGISSVWTLLYPAYSDVIDEITLKTKQRQEGVYTGIRTLFGRLPLVLQGFLFGLIHILTGFDASLPAGVSTQTELAKWGIRLHMSFIPFIFYLIAFFLMWKLYDLDSKKLLNIKKQLKESGL